MLTSYTHLKSPGKPLTVYIEGDGRAWITRTRLSDDPTPLHPTVFRLASKDASENVVYLGRPCQYDNSALEAPCSSEYWSNKRFSEEVIASMNEAVEHFKKSIGAENVRLIGYSGGAAVAVLVSARRQDVIFIRTIAGNLDHEAVSRYQKVSPLVGSLNPIDFAGSISEIPQEHFIGTEDKIIPNFIAYDFVKKGGDKASVQVIEVPGAGHDSRWEKTLGR